MLLPIVLHSDLKPRVRRGNEERFCAASRLARANPKFAIVVRLFVDDAEL